MGSVRTGMEPWREPWTPAGEGGGEGESLEATASQPIGSMRSGISYRVRLRWLYYFAFHQLSRHACMLMRPGRPPFGWRPDRCCVAWIKRRRASAHRPGGSGSAGSRRPRPRALRGCAVRAIRVGTLPLLLRASFRVVCRPPEARAVECGRGTTCPLLTDRLSSPACAFVALGYGWWMCMCYTYTTHSACFGGTAYATSCWMILLHCMQFVYTISVLRRWYLECNVPQWCSAWDS